MELLDEVDFDPETGLVPAIVQSGDDGRVLMLAYMDREALERTLERGRVTFWSRSREELWEKGATSGDWLEAEEVRTDCDGDALLVRARPHGPTCHTGEPSCFDAGLSAAVDGGGDREAPGGGDAEDGEPPRSGGRPPAAGGTGGDDAGHAGGPGPDLSAAAPAPAPVLASVLEELVGVIARRDRERPEGSYTAGLLEAGPTAAARKVGEEALETVLAAVDDPDRLAPESADLLYHLAVLWRAVGLPPDAVGRELAERRARSPGAGGSAPDGGATGSAGGDGAPGA